MPLRSTGGRRPFCEVRAILEAVPEFDARVNCIKHFKQIEVLDGAGAGSRFEALSHDARRGHGLAPSLWIYDELAQVQTRELLDALQHGMGKQPHSLGIVISTQAPDDQHALSELIDDGLAGLDLALYVQLHAAPPDADPMDPRVWRACNPALGKFLSAKDFAEQARRAARIPAAMSAFRNLRLDQRVHSEDHLIGKDDWLACGGEVDPDALRGQPVERGEVLCWAWMPDGRLAELQHSDRTPYRVWRDQGYLETTHGRAIDKLAVALRLAEISSRYNLQSVGFDEWRFADLQKILVDEDIRLPLQAMRQGFKTMGPCVDALESALVDHKLNHGNNPLMTWCASNVVAVTDPAGAIGSY